MGTCASWTSATRSADGLVTYPGLPAPVIADHLSFEGSHGVYAEGTEFAIGRIEMVSNTGTYLDTPATGTATDTTSAGLPLERCALLPGRGRGRGVRRRARRGRGVRRAGRVRGRGSGAHRLAARFGTEEYGAPEHPYLATDAAERLADAGAVLVGIDSVNIERHPRRWPAGAHAAPGSRDPDRRAPDRPRPAAVHRRDVHRRTGEGGRHVDVSGAGLRDSLTSAPRPISSFSG